MLTIDARIEDFEKWISQVLHKKVILTEDALRKGQYVGPDISLDPCEKLCIVQTSNMYNLLAVESNATLVQKPGNSTSIYWIQRIPERCDWTVTIQANIAGEFVRQYVRLQWPADETVHGKTKNVVLAAIDYMARLI